MTYASITVYTKPSCPQCTATKRHLDELGVAYDTESLTDDRNLAAAKALGHQSAPVVIVTKDGTDTHWSGYRPDLIDQTLKEAA